MKRIILILMMIFFIPLINFRGVIDVNIVRLPIFTSLSSILIILLLLKKTKRKFFQVDIRFVLISVIFPLILIVSSIYNNSLIVSFSEILTLISEFIFSYIIIIIVSLIDVNYVLRRISFIVASVILIVSILGVLQAVGIEFLTLSSISKPGSTLVSRNFAAAYAVSSIPFILISINFERNTKKVVILYLSFILDLGYLFLLRGRASIVSLIILTILLGGYYFNQKRNNRATISYQKKLIISAFAIAFFFSLVSFPNLSRKNFLKTVESITNINHPLNTKRIISWEKSIDMAIAHPFLGIGTGRWVFEFPKYNGKYYKDENIYKNSFINPHNVYLEYLSESGLFSLLFFLSLIYFTIYNLYIGSKSDFNFYLLLLSFISICIIAFFSFPHDRIVMMTLMFFIIGISVSLNKNHFININYKMSLYLSLLILLFATYFFVSRFMSERNYIEGIKHKFNEEYLLSLTKLNNINQKIYPLDEAGTPISYYQGVDYYALKDYESAEKKFIQAYNLFPFNPLIINNLASTKYLLGKFNEAKLFYLRSMNEFPNYFEPQVNLLAIYANCKYDSEAVSLIKKIEDRKPRKINNFQLFNKIKVFYHE